MKIYGVLRYEECDCHPLPKFGPFKRYKCDYLQDIQSPAFGLLKINLARPHRGVSTVGPFIKAFGSIWSVSVMWFHERR